MDPSWALVETGAENILAADWLADFAGINVSGSDGRLLTGVGGQVVEVGFVEAELRLHALLAQDVGFVPNWQAPFPVVLGQLGFLDQFMLTFHRGTATLAVEDWSAFDSRFGTAAFASAPQRHISQARPAAHPGGYWGTCSGTCP